MSKNVNDIARSNVIFPEARNPRQENYIASMQCNTQTFGLGPAGTGKTFLAACLAAFKFMRGDIDKIYMVRPTVEVGGERLGFLPGKLEAKVAPWVQPIVEILVECFGSRGRVDALIKEGTIAVQPFEYMRGRTFKDAFIIFDEAQNSTPKQMETFLTRIGENSTVVINGDENQTDLRGPNGLSEAIHMVEEYGIPAGITRFTTRDVERSGVCALWVEAYEMERAA